MRLGKLGSWVIILVWSVNFTLGHEDADDPDHKHEEIKGKSFFYVIFKAKFFLEINFKMDFMLNLPIPTQK